MNRKALISIGMMAGGFLLNKIGEKILAPIREREAQAEFESRLAKANNEDNKTEEEKEEESE